MTSYEDAINAYKNILGGFPVSQTTGGYDKRAVNQGLHLTNQQSAQYQLDLAKLDVQNAWQNDFYQQNESIPAQVRQMQQAGINPALMYGSAPSVSTSATSGTGGAPGSANSGSPEDSFAPLQLAMSVVSSLMGLASGSGDIASTIAGVRNTQADTMLKGSQQALNEQETFNKQLDAKFKEIGLNYEDIRQRLSLDSTRQSIAESKKRMESLDQSILESKSKELLNGKNIELFDKQIEVYDKDLSVKDSEIVRNAASSALMNAQRINVETMTPIVADVQRAYQGLIEAQTDTQRTTQAQQLMNAFQSYMSALVQQDIIDSGYWENLSKNLDMNSRNQASQIKWRQIGGIFNSVNSVIQATSGFQDIIYKPIEVASGVLDAIL